MSSDKALDDDNSIPQEASESTTEDGSQGETNVEKCGRGVKVFYVALVVALVALVVLLVVLLDHLMPWASGSDDDDASASLDDDDDDNAANTLAHVRELGKLKCGIVSGIVSEGFSKDLCRAIAAAALGEEAAVVAGSVDFVEVTPANRFAKLQNGSVDVLVAQTSITMERDIMEPTTGKGFTFSTPYLYTGLAFAGNPHFVDCADDLNARGNCTGIRICTVQDTTHVDILQDIYPGANLITAPTVATSYNNYRQELCQVIAGEQFTIAPAVLEEINIPLQDFKIGKNVFSKEPIAFATRHGDPEWSDFVNWVLQALLYAQEVSINSKNAKLLGTTNVFGPDLSGMFRDAVAVVGNYGEIYRRHLESIIPQLAGANAINYGDSGLIYALPFGKLKSVGTEQGKTLAEIKERGVLRCGISERALFAVKDPVTNRLSGHDVDFCRALAAAIFDGATDKVRYFDLSAAERFTALANGEVDVLSRVTTVTLSRDVLEPTTQVGFSFSQSNFYDGLSFGGTPPFGECANNLNTASHECKDLKLCVTNSTTFVSRVLQFFPRENLVFKDTINEVTQSLREGECNALAGGVVDVSRATVVQIGGFTGPYEIGTKRFTKDPLALVTRQDDEQWSSFVRWVVSAIFFAEEEGIRQIRSIDMPLVNLFGTEYSSMFRNAISEVGNFGEIYERNIEAGFPRASLNMLNSNPFGPQHYPYPGV